MSGTFEDFAKAHELQELPNKGGWIENPERPYVKHIETPVVEPVRPAPSKYVDHGSLWKLQKAWKPQEELTLLGKKPALLGSNEPASSLFSRNEEAFFLLQSLFKAMYGDTPREQTLRESNLKAVASIIQKLEKQRERYSRKIGKNYFEHVLRARSKSYRSSRSRYLALQAAEEMASRPAPKEKFLTDVIARVTTSYIEPLQYRAAQAKEAQDRYNAQRHQARSRTQAPKLAA